MNTSWHMHYPASVPATVNTHRFTSLAEMFDRACLRHAGNTAFVYQQGRISFDYLGQLVHQLAAWWQAKGFVNGDRIALIMPNCIHLPLAFFAALKAGCTVVNVCPDIRGMALEKRLQDARIKGLVTTDDVACSMAGLALPSTVEHVVITRASDIVGPLKQKLAHVPHRQGRTSFWSRTHQIRLKQALKEGSRLSFTPPPLSHADRACLQYTGTTTGSSKGVLLSHGNLLANLAQLKAYLSPVLNSGQPHSGVSVLPLGHPLALTCNLLLLVHLGITNLLLNDNGLPLPLVRELKRRPFSYITGTHCFYRRLVECPEVEDIDFSQLRLSIAGAEGIQATTAERWQAISGVPLTQGYDITEASSVVSLMPACPAPPRFTGSIGLPLPSTDISIRDSNGREQPTGRAGELCLRGPQLFTHYWSPRHSAATTNQREAPWWHDGFFRTGDIASINEQGYITLLHRPMEQDQQQALPTKAPCSTYLLD